MDFKNKINRTSYDISLCTTTTGMALNNIKIKYKKIENKNGFKMNFPHFSEITFSKISILQKISKIFCSVPILNKNKYCIEISNFPGNSEFQLALASIPMVQKGWCPAKDLL